MAPTGLTHRLRDRFISLRLAPRSGDVFVVAASQVGTLIVALGAGIVAARVLGPDGRGELGLALLVPLVLSLFLGFGSTIANVYLVASGQVTASVMSGVTTGLSLVGSVLGGILVTALWWAGALHRWLPHVSRYDLELAMVMLPVTLLYGAFRGLLRGLQSLRAAAVVDFAQAAFAAVSTSVALLVLNAGVPGTLIATDLAGVASLIALWLALRGHGLHPLPSFPRRETVMAVKLGVRSDLANLSQFFTYRLDSFLVNAIVSVAAVGRYTVATRLAELVLVLPSAVATVVLPRAAASDSAKLNEATPRTFIRTLVLCAAGGLLLAALADPGISLLYGHRYAGALDPALILLPGLVLVGGAGILTNEIAGRGNPGYNSINSLIGLVVTIGLDVVLIPRFGISGAALASTIAYTVNAVLAIVFFLRVSGLSPSDLMRRMRL